MGRRGRQFSFRFSVLSAAIGIGSAIRRRSQHSTDHVTFDDAPRPVMPARGARWEQATSRPSDQPYDIVIVGANAVGLWTALDAALRGMSVCLLEAHDFGAGSCTRMPKLVQGGTHDVQRAVRRRDPVLLVGAAEHQTELQTLRNIAPRLVKDVDVVVPVYRTTELIELMFCALVSAAMGATAAAMKPPKFLSGAQVKSQFPLAVTDPDEDDLQGAVVTRNALVDDTRLSVELACEASRHGAVVLNHALVVGMDKRRELRSTGLVLTENDRYWYSAKAAYTAWKEGKSQTDSAQDAIGALNRAMGKDFGDDNKVDRVHGVEVLDTVTGKLHTIPAKVVLNCAGHGADAIRAMVNPDSGARLFAHQSSVISYLTAAVTPAFDALADAATHVPQALLVAANHRDAKSFFIIPHVDPAGGFFVGGVDSLHAPETSTLTELGGVEPQLPAKPADIAFINSALDSFGISAGPIQCVLSPVIPLMGLPSSNPETIPLVIRFGDVIEMNYAENNMLTALGANWQAARCQAARLIDIAWRDIIHRPTDIIAQAAPPPPESRTRHHGIAAQVDPTASRRAVRLGAAAAAAVERLEEAEPGLRAPLVPGVPLERGGASRAEAVHAMQAEGAETALDVLRRSPGLYIDAAATRDAIPSVVDFMAARSGWDRKRKAREAQQATDFIQAFLPPAQV